MTIAVSVNVFSDPGRQLCDAITISNTGNGFSGSISVYDPVFSVRFTVTIYGPTINGAIRRFTVSVASTIRFAVTISTIFSITVYKRYD